MRALSDRVSELCEQTLGRLARGPSHDDVSEAKRRLSEPLRVAIAGNVNAGKSTLLNALLGERVAPTEQGECTQVVTWFRHGFPQRAEINFRDRARAPQPLELTEDGALPQTLGVDPEIVDSITVRRSNEVLEKDMILIDTPGLGSANAHISERTEKMLGHRSLAATGQADALIYVMTQMVRAGDQAAISAFRAQFPDKAGSAVNAIGVLNKADKGGGARDKRLGDAATTARKYASELSALVTDIVPMVGLLAESAERLDEDDASALRALGSLDPRTREWILEDPDNLLRVDTPVPVERRARLWDLLDAFGLECCLRWVDEGEVRATLLRTRLRETSGIDSLRTLLREAFAHRSHTLRVESVMAQLESVAYRPDSPNSATLSWLRGALDDLRLEPEWHALSEVRAMHAAAAHEADLPAGLREDLRRLVMSDSIHDRLGLPSGVSADARQRAALAGAARWRRASADWADDDPSLARIARIAQRSYTLLM